MSIEEIEKIIKELSHKTPGSDGFKGEFYQTFRDQRVPMLCKLLQSVENEQNLPN